MKNSLINILAAVALIAVLFTGVSAFAEDNIINPKVSAERLGTVSIGNTDDENAFGTRFDANVYGDPADPRYRNRG